MEKLKPGEVGPVTIQALDKATGKWVPKTRHHRVDRDKFRARCSVGTHGNPKNIRRQGDTPAAATDAVLEAAAKVSADILEPRTKSLLGADITLSQAVERFCEHLDTTNRAPGTLKLYKGTLRRHIVGSDLEHLTLTESNNPAILRDFLYAVDKTNGHGVARTLRSALTAFYKWAVTMRAIPVAEIQNVEPWKVPDTERVVKERKSPERSHDRSLTKTERDLLLSFALDWMTEPSDSRKLKTRAAAVEVAYFLAYTGVRISEALALRWEDVDLEGDHPRFHVVAGKTDKAVRTIYLPQPLLVRLRALRERAVGVWVFGAPTKPESQWNYQNFRNAFQGLLNDAGFSWMTSHSFRTSVAHLLASEGIGLSQVADLLGHSSPTVTLTYYSGRNSAGDAAVAKALGEL